MKKGLSDLVSAMAAWVMAEDYRNRIAYLKVSFEHARKSYESTYPKYKTGIK